MNNYQVVFVNGGCHVKNLSKYLLNSTLAIGDSGGTGIESGWDDVGRHLKSWSSSRTW